MAPFEPAMLEGARQRQRDDEAQMESDYVGLKPLEQAVLWRILERGPRFRPCDAEALKLYRDQVGKTSPQKRAECPGNPAPAHPSLGLEICPR
jgi:hypothetical protein